MASLPHYPGNPYLVSYEIYNYLVKDFTYARDRAYNYETYTNEKIYIKFTHDVQYEYAPNEIKTMEIIIKPDDYSSYPDNIDREVLVDHNITLENVKKILRSRKLKSVLSNI